MKKRKCAMTLGGVATSRSKSDDISPMNSRGGLSLMNLKMNVCSPMQTSAEPHENTMNFENA